MKTIGMIVVVLTLVLSAVAVTLFFTRNRQAPPSSPIAQPDSPDDRRPSPNGEKPRETSTPQPVPPPPPPREPFVEASKEKASHAMNEVIVKTTITNIKVAVAKGQNDMAGALAKGLKNYRPSAVRILEEDIPTVGDPAVKERLEKILIMLKEENQ